MPDSQLPQNTRLILFDGVCGLCNGFVDFIIKRDTKRRYYYSPLQGETAKQLGVVSTEAPESWSMYFYDCGEMYEQSTAVLRILLGLGGMWTAMKVFFIFPKSFRDCIYRYVATHRYKWFGRKEICRLPSESEKKFFLP